MRNFNGVRCIVALVLLGGTVNADIIIDNQSIPSSDIDSITISPATGNIFITTGPGYTVTPVVVGNGVAISSFTVSPGTIEAGESATLSWATENAVSCIATNGVGGWSGSNISLPSGNTNISTSVTGSHTFTLSCDGSEDGDTATSNVVLNVNSANAVSITSFSASPDSITEGGSTTLSWTTENATSCTPSGGTGGWGSVSIGLPNGNTQITIPTPSSYVFTLTCQGESGGSDVANDTVTVNPNVDSCDPAPLSGSVKDWDNFWGDDFPDPIYKLEDVTIARNGYVAIKFDTGNVIDDGRILSIENTSTAGIRLGAVSECPGDFDVAPECDYVWGLGGGMRWATNGRFGACQLQSNTTYYLNITFTDGVDSSSSTCASTPCVATMQHQNY
jgi:hypothetical protein